jgi:hypothetical protein
MNWLTAAQRKELMVALREREKLGRRTERLAARRAQLALSDKPISEKLAKLDCESKAILAARKENDEKLRELLSRLGFVLYPGLTCWFRS